MSNKIDIQIAVTFWNRFPERLESLKKTYDTFEKNVMFGKYTHEWFISCESERNVDKNLVEEFLKSKPNIKYVWKKGKPSLHSNLNNLLMKCTSPIIFYLQDDWVTTRPINIEQDTEFLLNSDYDVVRYRYSRREPDALKLINKDLNLYEISHKVNNLYSDQPHMKKITFHKKYGYFPESTFRGYDTGDCENKFVNLIKKTDAKFLFKKPEDESKELFKHVSTYEKSTLKEKWDRHPTIIERRKNKK